MGACRVLCLLSVTLFLASLAGAADPPAGKETILVFGRVADSIYLDPAQFIDNESAMVIENVFDGLVRYKDDSTDIEPALAESWDISPDGTTWTFHLRRGVRFHDGTPCDAEAVAFTIRRKTDPSHPYFRETFRQMDPTLACIGRVEVLDSITLRLTLKKPYTPLLSVLATHSSYIVSPAAVQKYGDSFSKHPVGTGPFRFSAWQPGERIVLKANREYWGGSPKLDEVVFKVVPDNRIRLLELKTGYIHYMDGINPEDRNEIQKSSGLTLSSVPGLNVGYLAMNTEKPPFDRRAVRLAVNHAINKENLVKLLFQGMAIPAKNPIPPTMWGYDDSILEYEYDPKKARQLLKEAGFPNGFETTLWTMTVPRPYMPEPEKTARAIQANLAAVGIRASIEACDWTTYLAKVYNGEHGLCLLGWVGTGDPNDFFLHLFAGSEAVKPHACNVAFFRNAQADERILRAQTCLDRTERLRIYSELQRIVHDEAPWVPLAHASQVMAFSNRAHGIIHHQTGVVRFYKAWLE